MNFILILTGVLLNAIAQLVLKKGMSIIGTVQVDMASIITMIMKAAVNVYIYLGLLCYILSFVVWLMVLSRTEVSYAYPFLSIGYIIAAFVGYFYFGESMTLYKVGGIILICFGVFLLYRS
ncbi:EamA family transporter [Pectinatus cerevisiiphilus]|uniref:EamA-like transporter family protein n=1 Tax=Pectinatus cerevisiiphilus TaxID=86956 RepID=A0A4R3KBW2_9FIRM|nr:EamA family transporter [Pectinatus cerevisiiphilus]TCS80577.1 EamA-like transporter family protein [Pectinatus cerevisiiphilus]